MPKTREINIALILVLTFLLSCKSYTGVLNRSKSRWQFLKGMSRAAVASPQENFTPLISVCCRFACGDRNLTMEMFKGDEAISVTMDKNGTRQFVVNNLLDDSNETRARYLLGRKKLKAKLDATMDTNQLEANTLFEEYSLYTASEKAEIPQRNDQFFQALKSNDVATLASLWLDSEDCLCRLSSRRELTNGHQNIVEYLGAVNLREEPTDVVRVSLKFMGDMAVVSSEVRGLSGHPPSPDARDKRVVVGYVTNVFVKSPDSERYQLLTHLGSLKETVHSPHHSVFRDPTILPPDPRKMKQSLSPMQGLLRQLNPDNGDDLSAAHADEDDQMDNDEYDDDLVFPDELDAEEASDEDNDIRAMMRMVPRQGGIVFVTPVDGESAAAGSSLEHIRDAMKASIRGRPRSYKEHAKSLQHSRSSSRPQQHRQSMSEQRDERHGIDMKREQRRSTVIDEEADGDYDEDYGDDLLGDEEEDVVLDQERRLVSFACESMIGWLEEQYGTAEHDERGSEVSLSPIQALALRTALIDSLMKNQPSPLEAAFCMLLCRQTPRYLGGDFVFDIASLPHSSSHFEQLLRTEDMADLVRLWKQYAAQLIRQERQGHTGTYVSDETTPHMADDDENDGAVETSHFLSVIEESSAKRLSKELSDVQGLIQVDAGLFQQLVQAQVQRRRSARSNEMGSRRSATRKRRSSNLSRSSAELLRPSEPSSQRSIRRRPSGRTRGGPKGKAT